MAPYEAWLDRLGLICAREKGEEGARDKRSFQDWGKYNGTCKKLDMAAALLVESRHHLLPELCGRITMHTRLAGTARVPLLIAAAAPGTSYGIVPQLEGLIVTSTTISKLLLYCCLSTSQCGLQCGVHTFDQRTRILVQLDEIMWINRMVLEMLSYDCTHSHYRPVRKEIFFLTLITPVSLPKQTFTFPFPHHIWLFFIHFF